MQKNSWGGCPGRRDKLHIPVGMWDGAWMGPAGSGTPLPSGSGGSRAQVGSQVSHAVATCPAVPQPWDSLQTLEFAPTQTQDFHEMIPTLTGSPLIISKESGGLWG